MIADATSQIEYNGQAGKIARTVFDGTIGGENFRYVLLRQLNVFVHDERIGHIPNEHQISYRVRH